MAKIVTLKNSNDEEVYPITTAEAVNGGLYADSEGTPSTITADVTTSRIVDGAVTSDKIDWTTLAPTSTTSTSSSMTWYKRVFPDGTIVYSGYGSPSWWTGGNAWYSDITIPLPDSLTFHPSKMLASINLQPADSAVQAWGSVHSGSTSWVICRGNRYSGEITTAVHINATLVVFPN